MSSFKSFEELACWKEARFLRNFVKNKIISKFPSSEKYESTSQIRRSSRPIGNNIAEGLGKFNYQENIQFCRIARGSLTETLDHVIIALDEGYISEQNLSNYREIHYKALRILNGHIKYLKDSKLKKD